MTNQNKITRYLNVEEFRALEPTDDTGYIIEGYAIVYEQSTNIGGYFTEIIKRGALDGADLTDVPFFIAHETRKIPLARSRRNNPYSTLQLKVDEKGLYFRAMLDVENNMEAKALYSSVKRGDLSGCSFSFRVNDEKWLNLDSSMPTREIYKFDKIGEISCLYNPAYDATEIYARSDESLDSDKLALDNVRHRLSLESDKNELELLKSKLKLKLM